MKLIKSFRKRSIIFRKIRAREERAWDRARELGRSEIKCLEDRHLETLATIQRDHEKRVEEVRAQETVRYSTQVRDLKKQIEDVRSEETEKYKGRINDLIHRNEELISEMKVVREMYNDLLDRELFISDIAKRIEKIVFRLQQESTTVWTNAKDIAEDWTKYIENSQKEGNRIAAQENKIKAVK